MPIAIAYIVRIELFHEEKIVLKRIKRLGIFIGNEDDGFG